MADSILRLRVDSKEYDDKLKRASQGIMAFADESRKAGQSLTEVNQSTMAYVKALGNMGTVAKASKTQLREMTSSLTDLTQVYRSLTDSEKASEFGQALFSSIQQLTERAGAVRDAMADVSQSINNAASDTRRFDQIAGGVTFITSSMQALQGAAKLAGIELGDNVEVLAKLQAAMAVTSGLQQLQNLLQKQSALMEGINALQKEFNILAKANPYVLLASAVAAVAAAYLAWEANGRKAKHAQQALNAELEHTKVQLQQIDKDTDFSVGIAQAAGKSWRYIHELRLEAARTKLALADMAYDKLVSSGNATADQMKNAASLQQSAWEGVMKVLNEGTIHEIQMRNAGKGGGGRGGGRGGIGGSSVEKTEEQQINEEISKLTNEYIKATDSRRQAIEREIASLQKRNEEIQRLKKMAMGESFTASELPDVVATAPLPPLMKMEDTIKQLTSKSQLAKTPEEYQSIQDDIEAVRKEIKKFKSEEDKEEKKEVKLLGEVGNIAGGVSGVFSGIEQLGVELPEGLKNVLNGVTTVIGILSSIATIVTAIEAISAADTIIPFHTGGVARAAGGLNVVPGNWGHDMVPALLQSGEVVLNRAQQGNLSAQLANNNAGMQLTATLRGEDIQLSINNRSRRRGRGEYVTTKFR